MSIHPATPDRWQDLCDLFGPRGAYANCWCMWWRDRRGFGNGRTSANREAMQRLVDSGQVPGLIAYDEGQAVGWCSVTPLECLVAARRSRVLRHPDPEPVWAIVCFFVRAGRRRQGISRRLLDAAVEHALAGGAATVQGYPVSGDEMTPLGTDGFMGSVEMFEAAGFVRAARSGKRWIVHRSGHH